jgi:hypothetical protein
MLCKDLPEEMFIYYMDQDIKVQVDCTMEITQFNVYLPGEEGHLVIQM